MQKNEQGGSALFRWVGHTSGAMVEVMVFGFSIVMRADMVEESTGEEKTREAIASLKSKGFQ